jgi:hypothetical protein
MNAESALSCPQCATPRDIYRYCMNCGFDFSADTDGEQVDVLAAEEAPLVEVGAPVVGGSSASVLLVMIAVAVAVLLLIVAALFIPFGASDDTPVAGDATSSDTGSPPSSEPSEAAPADCWDGTSAATPAQCPALTGSAGLAWVFPSVDRDECTDEGKGPGKPAKWVCRVPLADGGTVRIRYREHKSVDKGLAKLSRTYGEKSRDEVLSERDDVVRYVWRAPEADSDGRWSLSSMYAEHPWSVTIKGDSADDVEDALTDAVEFRNPRRLDV